MYNFKGKVVVVTGGAQGIGKCICEQFEAQGANVCTIDLQENPCFVGDVGKKEDLERFAEQVLSRYGRVDVLVNNAKPLFLGLEDCSYEDFCSALNVGVTAAF